ncbi:MAG: DUF1697 domain-containing protein [Polyangiaceae bacterium]
MRLVALLRGINVGGKNKLPMKDLVAMFERAGCTNVAHYIQSGNVVFDAPASLAKKISSVIESDIKRRAKLDVPVVIREAAHIKRVATSNPFTKEGKNEDFWHVVFLKDMPSKDLAALLDPNRSPGDRFVVRGEDVYLHCVSVAKTKLTNAFFDSKLKTVSTGRNWRTVLKLAEMCGES